jgi:hypothetical protein
VWEATRKSKAVPFYLDTQGLFFGRQKGFSVLQLLLKKYFAIQQKNFLTNEITDFIVKKMIYKWLKGNYTRV